MCLHKGKAAQLIVRMSLYSIQFNNLNKTFWLRLFIVRFKTFFPPKRTFIEVTCISQYLNTVNLKQLILKSSINNIHNLNRVFVFPLIFITTQLFLFWLFVKQPLNKSGPEDFIFPQIHELNSKDCGIISFLLSFLILSIVEFFNSSFILNVWNRITESVWKGINVPRVQIQLDLNEESLYITSKQSVITMRWHDFHKVFAESVLILCFAKVRQNSQHLATSFSFAFGDSLFINI